MGVEILGADTTLEQVEVTTETDSKTLSNLGKELDEPTKPNSIDGLNVMTEMAKEDAIPANSNIPKNAKDEWPEPKQIHSFYFVRIRSHEDPELRAKIEQADKDLQRKNQTRFQITEALKAKRSQRSNLKSQLQPFLAEKRKHNTIMDEKRKEMEPLREDLHKLRTANNAARERSMGLCSSEEELNHIIQSLHYRIQHESNTLNEEKQLLKEIKQLEATREKVIANAAMKGEIEDSKGQKVAIQDRVKLLGVNMDEVRKEREAVKEQIKQMDDEISVVEADIVSLEEELKSATERRDRAYETLNALRKARDEVNACFYQNRSLLNSAKELAAKKDISALEELCNNEVEKFMSQWSSNKVFRDDYERRILGSLDNRQLSRDGRMRNPDEKPIIVPAPPATKSETTPLEITPKQVKKAVNPPLSQTVTLSTNGADSEELTKSTQADIGGNTSSKEELGEANEYEPSKELSKPKEFDPVKLKEMKREEEIAKAKLALERKKKLAEKAAVKAAARAEKEAEKKLKQKGKKAKKKAGTTEPDLPSESTEEEVKPEEPEKADEKAENPILEPSKEKPKVNARYRNRPKVKDQLPRVILKRKKSNSYVYWAASAVILAVVLVAAGYYFAKI